MSSVERPIRYLQPQLPPRPSSATGPREPIWVGCGPAPLERPGTGLSSISLARPSPSATRNVAARTTNSSASAADRGSAAQGQFQVQGSDKGARDAAAGAVQGRRAEEPGLLQTGPATVEILVSWGPERVCGPVPRATPLSFCAAISSVADWQTQLVGPLALRDTAAQFDATAVAGMTKGASSACATDLTELACSTQFPRCAGDGWPVPPCRHLCERVASRCGDAAVQLFRGCTLVGGVE
jgi:hypothetical protein